MRKKTIEGTVKEAERLATAAESLMVTLSGFVDANAQPFNVRQTIRGTDSTTSDVLARIQSVVGIIENFGNANSPELVPASFLNELTGTLGAVTTSMEAIVTQIVNINSSQGGLNSFTYKNFVAQSKDGNAVNMDGSFQTFFSASENLLEKFFRILNIVKPRSSYSFQAASHALGRIIDGVNESIAASNAALKQISTTEGDLKAKEDAATSNVEEISRLLTAGETDRQNITEYLAQATTKQAEIQTIHEGAKKLEDAIKAYRSDFEEFQAKLNDREIALSDGSKKFDELVSDFNEFRSTVESTIKRSEQMLSTATVAGLASNFGKMTDQLTKELWWARFAFYTSIGLLLISAIPIFAIILMPILNPILQYFYIGFPSLDSHSYAQLGNEWQYLAQVVGRIVILLPAAWLVQFTAIRHSSLFRLREHYAYKYSMAVAVEGFKQQAPGYSQEIAAMVLEELAFNPADKLVPSKDIREGKAPGLAGHILEKIRGGAAAANPNTD